MTPARCARCPNYRTPVPPSGPTPCRILFLSECPTREDDRTQVPFQGKPGMELNDTYLPILGVPRSMVYILNSVMCSRKDYSIPESDDALSCMGANLGPVLEIVKPEIIAPLGPVACSLWPEINLNRDHGLPVVGKWGAWQGVLWPMYHPSAGINSPSFMIPLQTDFHMLKLFLRQLGAG